MVRVDQGDVWLADLPDPVGSAPGYFHPVIIVQCNAFNWTSLATVVCVVLTTTLKWADVPGNVLIPAAVSGLSEDSVANVSQIVTIDRGILAERVGPLPRRYFARVLAGIETLLGR